MSGIVLLVLVLVGGYYVWKLVKNRAGAFAAAAPAMGYTYSAHDSPFGGTDNDGIPLIVRTAQHKYRNVLTAKSGSPVIVSEYQYWLPANRKNAGAITDGSDVQVHSLVAYRIAHGSLPKFQVYSHGVFGNMGLPLEKDVYRALMGGSEGLDLGDPDFAKRYRVFSDNEAAVRMLFSPFLMRALLEQPKMTWLHIQCSPDWLLFYDPTMLILKPEAIAPALARLQPIADRILGTAPGEAGGAKAAYASTP